METIYHFNPKINELLNGFVKEGGKVEKKTENLFKVSTSSGVFQVDVSDYNRTRKVKYVIPQKKGEPTRLLLKIVAAGIAFKIIMSVLKAIKSSLQPVPEDNALRKQQQNNSSTLSGLLGAAWMATYGMMG